MLCNCGKSEKEHEPMLLKYHHFTYKHLIFLEKCLVCQWEKNKNI